jgi:hypothetical protein
VAFGALISGSIDGAKGPLDLMAAAARDPEPGEVGAALELISQTTEAAISLIDDEETRWGAFGLIHLALSLAATELAIPRS